MDLIGFQENLYTQQQANPRVELNFMCMAPLTGLRFTREAEIVEDIGLKEAALEERSFLKALGMQRADDPYLVFFRIAHGEAHFWKWENNLKESAIPRIVFFQGEPRISTLIPHISNTIS